MPVITVVPNWVTVLVGELCSGPPSMMYFAGRDSRRRPGVVSSVTSVEVTFRSTPVFLPASAYRQPSMMVANTPLSRVCLRRFPGAPRLGAAGCEWARPLLSC